jgi:hypothetical protein
MYETWFNNSTTADLPPIKDLVATWDAMFKGLCGVTVAPGSVWVIEASMAKVIEAMRKQGVHIVRKEDPDPGMALYAHQIAVGALEIAEEDGITFLGDPVELAEIRRKFGSLVAAYRARLGAASIVPDRPERSPFSCR